MQICEWKEFNYDIITKAKNVVARGKRRSVKTVDIISAFDIETTSIKSKRLSFMYIWQWAFGDVCYIGRTWHDFRNFVDIILKALKGRRLIVYVHNLSYEFFYLKSILEFTPESVFALSTRKVARTRYKSIEFRCSYVLTNMSLEEFTHKMDVEHKKVFGFDYEDIRYPWTELNAHELEYVVNDVVGLCESLEVYMKVEHDNLLTVPMTSTGYVRRDMHQALDVAHLKFDKLNPGFEFYQLLREAFRGGDTHANRWYVGVELDNVESYDRASSYPDVIMNCKFPMTPFRKVDKLPTQSKFAYCARFTFYNIRLRDDGIAIPYISYAKALYIQKDNEKEWLDNGRVLCARVITLALTDVDYEIVSNQYVWDSYNVNSIWRSEYGMLPDAMREVVMYYFAKKTELKNVDGQEVFYLKSKNKLNAIYGMAAQNPGKLPIKFENNKLIIDVNKDLEEVLSKYYSKDFSLPYQWGVWTTALARRELHRAVDMVGQDCIYVDTDSVKFIGEHSFEEINKYYNERSVKNGATYKNAVLGVYEHDASYEKFKTLGAKKYVYIKDGKLDATIAGVAKPSKYNPDKKYGAQELDKNGGMDAFKPGFVFTDSAGNEVVYNEVETPYMLDIDGGTVEITSNIYMEPTTYTITLEKDYAELLLSLLFNMD